MTLKVKVGQSHAKTLPMALATSKFLKPLKVNQP